MLAGFTNRSAVPNAATAAEYSIRDPAVVVIKGTSGRPASRIRRLATSLSIAVAEPVTAEPT